MYKLLYKKMKLSKHEKIKSVYDKLYVFNRYELPFPVIYEIEEKFYVVDSYFVLLVAS